MKLMTTCSSFFFFFYPWRHCTSGLSQEPLSPWLEWCLCALSGKRIKCRFDSLLFVSFSYSARDMTLSRMILALWRFWSFSPSGPSSFGIWRCSSLQHPSDVLGFQMITSRRSTSRPRRIFLFCPSSSQTSHHQGWEVFHYNDCLYFRRTVMSFSHTPDRYWYTVRCGYQNGALIPIEGVKNTRKGGLNWVFKIKNFSPLF